MLAMVAVLIWRYNALQCVDKKDIQPKMFKDIQTEDSQTKDIQRYSNHLEEGLWHRLAKYVSRYTAVHTWWGEGIIEMFFGTVKKTQLLSEISKAL